jgi:hypothetical protein
MARWNPQTGEKQPKKFLVDILKSNFKTQVLIHNDLKEPTDLIVDPNSHYLYWTDAGMDGIFRVNPELLSTQEELKPELVRSDIAEATGIAIVGQNVISYFIYLHFDYLLWQTHFCITLIIPDVLDGQAAGKGL